MLNWVKHRERWERFGARGLIYGGLLDVLQRALDLNVFLVNRNAHVPDQLIPDDVLASFEFRPLTHEEVRRHAAEPGLELGRELVDEGLARGDYCFGVLRGGKLVAYDWRGISRDVPLNHDLDVRYRHPGQVYGYAMFTVPEYRGQRLQLYNLRSAETLLLRQGHTHTIGYVALQNFQSIRNLSRIRGQVFVGKAGYLRLFGRYLTFSTPGARRYGFTIIPRAAARAQAAQAAPAAIR